jgi:uncharacterized protein with GYD domain
MPKYLVVASYTPEGVNGLFQGGGTARRAVVEKMLEGLGGRLEAFYFAFGEDDAYLTLDLPDNATAATISLSVKRTGAVSTRTIVLLTPEEIDQAVKKPVDYQPPKSEVQEVADAVDRMIDEGGKD